MTQDDSQDANTKKDEDARKARAQRLRDKIDRLNRGGDDGAGADQAKPESPRTFIGRRMRELEEKKKK